MISESGERYLTKIAIMNMYILSYNQRKWLNLRIELRAIQRFGETIRAASPTVMELANNFRKAAEAMRGYYITQEKGRITNVP